MGYQNSRIWIALLLVLFTPVAQALDIEATRITASKRSEKCTYEPITLNNISAKGDCHRGSGRRN